MKFDRMAPGKGAEATARLENGKIFLEWRFHVQEDESLRGPDKREQVIVKVSVTDETGNTAAECVQFLEEEEPLETILIQPRLWQGIQNPFRYYVKASLIQNGKYLDSLVMRLPLRVMETGRDGEPLLNQQPFLPRAVRYAFPAGGSEPMGQKLVMEDFQRLLKLGANCICGEGEEFRQPARCREFFWQLCDRFGFLLFVPEEEEALEKSGREQDLPGTAGKAGWVCAWNPAVGLPYAEEIPLFRGKRDSLFRQEDNSPTTMYYQYRARWSTESFVYIVPESIRKLKSGNYTVTCYSGCGKTALYSDGILFGFQEGRGELVFWEVPAKGPCIRLSAEGEGFVTSFSVHKSFTARYHYPPEDPAEE